MQLEEALVSLQTPDEATAFMSALFSPSEIKAFQHRWQAFEQLIAGSTQREVASQIGVSIATVSRAAAVIHANPAIIVALLGRAEAQGAAKPTKRRLPRK